MNQEPLIEIQQATAAEVCENYQPEKEATQLLRDGISRQEFVAALLDKKRYVDAIDFIAHALPVRDGIWWGCLCMQHALGDDLAPPDRAAAAAAVRWLMQPTEENRAAAKAPGEAADPLSPAGAVATAVWQTGGSMAPPNAPPEPPSRFAPAQAVARAVKLASIKMERVVAETQRCYVELGIEVARGALK
jgi:hypothetical protein